VVDVHAGEEPRPLATTQATLDQVVVAAELEHLAS
jgi:hypothetical protein